MKAEISPSTQTPHDLPESNLEGEQTAPPKKPFVRPVLTRHATLPAVTGAFFGSFRP